MLGTQARITSIVRQLGICITIAAALSANMRSTHAAVKIFDGFGDADRNNDGAITGYDTDLNDSGTFNDFTFTPGPPPVYSGPDGALASRGITEVTAAQDASDVGIVWSGIRSFDTTANLVKSKLRIINDNVATGVEASTDIHNHGLALGVESAGGGSSFIGRFGQSIALGPNVGDRVVASVDWRHWREANNNVTNTPGGSNELRWGLYQDTDGEFGQTANYGTGWFANNGAPVVWGRDDGKWFDSQPGAEGDKGIQTGTTWGSAPFSTDARIRWENNVANINGGTNNGRILEGNGATEAAGGGDTGTIASPPGNGTGGVITDLTGPTPYAPHSLKMEIVRLANGLVEVASFVDNVEILRDSIKTADTGYSSTLQSIPFTYDYVAFRNANNDWDYVIDNFKVEVFESGDYNQNDVVDAADYLIWRKNNGITTGGTVPKGDGDVDRDVDVDDYNLWRSRFGLAQSGSGASLGGGAVPEPGSVWMLLVGAIAVHGCARRRFV
jgi:hypothetical protein